MDRKPITAKGYKNVQEELKNLIKNDRPKIIQDIATARAHGDLKENAEYHAAKERQGFIEGRIQRLNHVIANSDIIEVAKVKAKAKAASKTLSKSTATLSKSTTSTLKKETTKETPLTKNKAEKMALIAKAFQETTK